MIPNDDLFPPEPSDGHEFIKRALTWRDQFRVGDVARALNGKEGDVTNGMIGTVIDLADVGGWLEAEGTPIEVCFDVRGQGLTLADAVPIYELACEGLDPRDPLLRTYRCFSPKDLEIVKHASCFSDEFEEWLMGLFVRTPADEDDLPFSDPYEDGADDCAADFGAA